MKIRASFLAVALPMLACAQGVDGDPFGPDQLGVADGDQDDEETLQEDVPAGDAGDDGDVAATCEPMKSRLVAVDRTNVGEVTVTTVDEGLWVEVETSGQWRLSEVEVFAGLGVPPNDGEALTPESFPFADQLDRARTAALAIPFEALESGACGEEIVVAVHAQVVRIHSGEVVEERAAWGEGDEGVDAEWGSELDVLVCCD